MVTRFDRFIAAATEAGRFGRVQEAVLEFLVRSPERILLIPAPEPAVLIRESRTFDGEEYTVAVDFERRGEVFLGVPARWRE